MAAGHCHGHQEVLGRSRSPGVSQPGEMFGSSQASRLSRSVSQIEDRPSYIFIEQP